MEMTIRNRIEMFRLLVRVAWALRRPLIRKSLPLFDNVESWAKDWKAQGYHILGSEKLTRFARLSRAHRLAKTDLEGRRLGEACWVVRNPRRAFKMDKWQGLTY